MAAESSAFSVSDLHENQRRILRALDDHGGRANTSELREQTGIASSTIGYHVSVLQPDLVVDVGSVDVGAPVEATVWALTDEGERVVGAIGESLAPGELEVEVRRLRDEVGDLRDALAAEREARSAAESRVAALETERDDLAERVETVESVLERLIDEVQ